MRLVRWILALALLVTPVLAAEPPLDGDWDGTLVGRLRLVLHLEGEPLSGNLTSVDQGNQAISLASVSRNGTAVTFTIAAPAVTFTGTLSEDGKTISGDFKQGDGVAPLVLTRRPAGAPAPMPVARVVAPRTWQLVNTTPRFLTSTAGVDYDAVFSPDGKRVLFNRSSNGRDWAFMIVPVAGGEAKPFTAAPLPVSPTRSRWFRNGLIAFTGLKSDGSAGVWLVNEDGSNPRQIIATGLSNQIFYPSWYPDGKHLAVMDGADLVTKRIDIAGGAAVNLTDRARVFTGMGSVSPDGKYRVFAGQENKGQPYDQTKNIIWLAGEDGTLKPLEAQPQMGRAPTWSPDGKRVAFESDRGSPDGRYAVFIVNADGSGLAQVTDYGFNGNHPVFSPDGRQMIFTAQDARTRTTGIAIIDLP